MDHSKEFTIAGALSVLTICFFQQRQLASLRTEIKAQRILIDSINNESFINKTAVDRYELTLTDLKENDPKTAEKFEKGLNKWE